VRYKKHYRKRGNALVACCVSPEAAKSWQSRAIEDRGAQGRALPVSAPAGMEDRSSRPKTSPRGTPERNCLAAPPAADGQTHRDRNPPVGNHGQPGPQAVSRLSWRGTNMRAEGGVNLDVGIAQAYGRGSSCATCIEGLHFGSLGRLRAVEPSSRFSMPAIGPGQWSSGLCSSDDPGQARFARQRSCGPQS